MANKKILKWVGFFASSFAILGVVISVPFISSSIFWSNYRKNHALEYINLKYKLPKNLGEQVPKTAFKFANPDHWTSKNIGDIKKYQNDIENTFLFAGGSDFYSDWDKDQSFKGLVGLFEENIRWTLSSRGGDNPTFVYSSLGRFTINISKPNQTLKEINDNFDYKVKRIDPQNVVTVVGSEYVKQDNINKAMDDFIKDLRTFVNKSLELRNNTANVWLMTHWKVPNPTNSPVIEKYNSNVEKLNRSIKIALSTLTKEQIPRVLLIDNEDLFLNLEPYYYDYFDSDLWLTRIGNNELAKNLLIHTKPINPATNAEWKPADWTDYSKTFSSAWTLDWSTHKEKNHLNINVSQEIKQKDTSKIANLTVTLPSKTDYNGKKLRWLFEFDNRDVGVKIEDYSTVNQDQLIIDEINLYETGKNKFTLTVFDDQGKPFNRYYGDLEQQNNILKNNTNVKTFTKAQQKFMDKFNDKSKPMVWTFIGDSIDHGAWHNGGFDSYPEVVQKSVKNDWKRYDDIFVNAAMSGDFTNRSVDPFQLKVRNKYKADVVSIGLGITDGLTQGLNNGQQRNTTKEQFQKNFKTLVESAKEANPDVIVVVNAINPTASGRKDIPGKYNPYLKEIFETDSKYSDYVIYNEKVFTEMNTITSSLQGTQGDGVLMATDKLHTGGYGNIIKAKTFLESLGVNVKDSYLSNYFVTNYGQMTSENSNNNIGNIETTISNGQVTPKISTWSTQLPINQQYLGSVFMTFKNTDNSSERIYYLTTGINVREDKYKIYLQKGTYAFDAWGLANVNYRVNGIQQVLQTPISQVVVN